MPEYWKAMWVNVRYAFIATTIQTALGFFLTVMLIFQIFHRGHKRRSHKRLTFAAPELKTRKRAISTQTPKRILRRAA